MSRIHGARQIVQNSIEDQSIRAVGGGYTGIANDKLAPITGSDMVSADALSGVVDPAHGGTGVNNGTSTLTLGGNVEFSGAFGTTLTVTGTTALTLPQTGTLANQDWVNQQVGAMAEGLDLKESCLFATTADLSAATYSNVTKTLTNGSNGVFPTMDDVTPVSGARVLVWQQDPALENGIYEITALGDTNNPFILTRTADADNTPNGGEVTGGMYTFIEQGTLYGGHGFVVIWEGEVTIGTNPVNFSQFSGTGSLSSSAGTIAIVGNNIDLDEIWLTPPSGAYNSVSLDVYGRVTAASKFANLTEAGMTATTANIYDADGLVQLATTVAELNAINGAACDNADFVKLHDLTVSNIDIGNIVTVSSGSAYMQYLDDVVDGGSGADMVGVTGITGLLSGVNTTAQTALEALQAEFDALYGTGGAALVGISPVSGLTGATVQAALEALEVEITSIEGDISSINGSISSINGTISDIQGDISDIQGATSNMVDYEDLTAQADGTAALFTVAGPFITGTLKVWDNGLLLRKGADQDFVETSDTAGTFTFVATPPSGTEILVSYRGAAV